eukprot:CFRG7978T1
MSTMVAQALEVQQNSIDSALTKNYESFDRRITFKKATWAGSTSMENTTHKPLNVVEKKFGYDSETNIKKQKKSTKDQKTDDAHEKDINGEQLPKPGRILFPQAKIENIMKWQVVSKAGGGLYNYSNTCFLNSVLQCLMYTPPVANYLLSGEHARNCQLKNEPCAFCEMESLTKTAHGAKNNAIYPKRIVGSLKVWAKHFRKGRQEDAHEFLRYLIDAMQKACLAPYDSKMDANIKATTFIHQVFGGYTRSQVRCLVCNFQSNTYDESLDLSLDIKNAKSLTKALAKFTVRETLEKDNKYMCEKCNKKVDAVKQMTVHTAPAILVVHLKRFDYMGGKVRGHVPFDEKLDLTPYMSKSYDKVKKEKCTYSLICVMVHAGYTTRSGHYYCYVKGANGMWYEMDDESVNQVKLPTVLRQEAYMMFYSRDSSKQSSAGVNSVGAKSASEAQSIAMDTRKEINQRREKYEKEILVNEPLRASALPVLSNGVTSSTGNDKKRKKDKMKAKARVDVASTSVGLKKTVQMPDPTIVNGISTSHTNEHESSDSEREIVKGMSARKAITTSKSMWSIEPMMVPNATEARTPIPLQSENPKKSLGMKRKFTSPASLLYKRDNKKPKIKHWDESIGDDLSKMKKNAVRESFKERDIADTNRKTKSQSGGSGALFDGLRDMKKDNELSSIIGRSDKFAGLGGKVGTWENENTKSMIDTIRHNGPTFKSSVMDTSYTVDDREIDQGRVKKVKQPKMMNPKSNINHFQKEGERKSMQKKVVPKKFNLKSYD